MPPASDSDSDSDAFDLQRFVDAQAHNYADALAELRNGRKRTHWMWYVFPQFDGLGYSETAKRYAIKSVEEARQYLAHPVLGQRLAACAEALLALHGRSASAIFGAPDDVKLHSSMTLFAAVSPPESLFAQVLGMYFAGERDSNTIELLGQQNAT